MAKQKLIGAGIVAVCLLFVGAIGIGLLQIFNRPPLPPLEGIVGIRLRDYYDKAQHKDTDFSVPQEYWGEILAALSPYEMDQHPADWKILACMDVSTKFGKKSSFLLFYLENESVGAFKFRDVYYRGGNSRELREVVVKACDKSKSK
jgi:hypothetical protein